MRHKLDLVTSMRAVRRGQSSLEMTVAIAGLVLLLLGSVKIFAWLAERIVSRQQSYEATRQAAGNGDPGKAWNEPSKPLKIFDE